MRKHPLPLAIALACIASPVVAQQDKSFALEEVVVTAQKRDQSQQAVPIAVQAFSAEAIREVGATVMSDLKHIAPSFQMGGLGAGSQQHFGLRGVVDYSRNIGIDSRMGVYIDGVYQGRSFSADQPLLGLESVEMLRGPQGTLFGKNTVSGAINLVTKQPTEVKEGEIQAEIGDEGYTRGSGYFSGPISDSLFGSVSYSYDRDDGYYRNVTLNKDTGDYDRKAWRGKLRWLANDNLDITLAGDGSKYRSNDVFAIRRSDNDFESAQNFESNDTVDFWGASVTANYAFNGYTLTSITAHREGEYTARHDDDLTPLNIQVSTLGEDTQHFSQELRLVSPVNDSYDWVAGIYYFDNELAANNNSCFGEDLYNVVIAPLAAYAQALTGCTVVPTRVDGDMLAAYVHGNYRFTEKLELTAGIRFTQEDKSIAWAQQNSVTNPAVAAVLQEATGLPLTQAPGALFGAINYSEINRDRSENDISPTIGLNYFVSDDIMIYGKYAGAFKSGGYNAEFMLAGLNNFEYEDENVDSYELGIKSTLLGGKLRLNATSFMAKYDDYQVFQFLTSASGATSLQLTNAGKVTSKGYELEMTYLPTDRLRMMLNIAKVDAVYDEFANPVAGQTDFTGNALPYAPDMKVFAGIQYLQPVWKFGNLTFNLDYSHIDDQFSDPSNSAVDAIESYSLVNARVALTPANGKWELALWGKNLSDKVYNAINNDNFLGTPRTVLGEPMRVGISATYFIGE